MTELDDILAAFEENLVLARELGARSFEMDRALLAPLPPAQGLEDQKPHLPANAASTNVHKLQLSTNATNVTNVNTSPAQPILNSQFSILNSPLVLLVGEKMEGAAADLFKNMVSAMGLAEGETHFVEVPKVPTKESAEALVQSVDSMKPKAIVLFGREAMQVQALAGGTARRGAWGVFRGVQAIATYHPARMLAFWAKDVQGMRKAKLEVWNVLKDALAHVGRKPPARK